MKKYKLEPGSRFGMLTYIGPADKVPTGKIGNRTIYATCGKWRCDCGKEVVKWNRNVVSGRTKSCGCLRMDKGKAWKKGKRAMEKAKNNAVLRTPTIPVYLVQQNDSDIVEVCDPANELVLWCDGDGLDVMYDMAPISRAFRRKNSYRWECIDIVDLAGILEKTPGVKVWTGKEEPPVYNASMKGWEVVGRH